MLKIGDLLGGKYRILSVVGRGGMSTVYLARNERANKNWAVKEVRKSGVNQDQVVEQSLLTEVEIMKHLNNPHLPSIIDVIDIDDTFVIVMDFVEGNSLEKVLEHGSVSEIQVIDLAKQLCDVLLYLHSCNPPIIYRDMNPSNVVLRPDGVVMLLDFGTAMPPGIVMDSCDEWYVAGEHAPWSEQLIERFLKAAGKAAGEGFSEKVKRLNVEE